MGIICGDSASILPTLASGSVDLIVTDPPYGIKFMGREWDKAVPPVAIWKECLRVLKPGAFAFVMSGPRMDCLSEMGRRLAEVGFETGFSPIFWAYASGFNKSGNMSKLVDKRACRDELKAKLGRSPTKEEMKEAWEGFREVVGVKPGHEDFAGRTTKGHIDFKDSTEGFDRPWMHDDQARERYHQLTAPTTPEAQALDGSYAGFQPKPSVEVMIVAMKPLEHKTYIDQALDNRKGITWLDDGRIPYESEEDKTIVPQPIFDSPTGKTYGFKTGEGRSGADFNPQSGRFPANLLCSDDAVDDGRVTKSPSGFRSSGGYQDAYVGGKLIDPIRNYQTSGGDEGSFSRYFSLDAWWAERLKDLPESAQRTFPFLVVPKAGKKEKNLGCEGLPEVHAPTHNYEGRDLSNPKNVMRPGMQDRRSRNAHPTVKPLKLMSYLITLGSRPGDLVLDPFAGTCTTGMAAKVLGRDYLMIELDEEWCRIGLRRIDAVQAKLL